MQDYRGHDVSGADGETVERFEAALKSFQTFFGDAISQADDCLARSPAFVMGHVLRAIAYYLTSERRFAAPARESLQAAEACAANERETMHVAAVAHLLAGRWFDACGWRVVEERDDSNAVLRQYVDGRGIDEHLHSLA